MLPQLRTPSWHRSLARLAWVLLLWPGPIPVVHSHGTLSNSESGLPELAEHLVRFHPDVDALEDVRFDWHVHWVLSQEVWCDSEGGEPLERALVPSEWSRTFVPAPPSPDDYIRLADISDRWQGLRCEAPRFSHPAQFFGTFCEQLSLPERLGVMLL